MNTNITINNNFEKNNNNYNFQNDSSFTKNVVNNIINIKIFIIQQSNTESTQKLFSLLKNNNSNIFINNISHNDSNDNIFKNNFIKTFNNNYNYNYENGNCDDNIFWLKQELNDNNNFLVKIINFKIIIIVLKILNQRKLNL